MRRTHSLLVSAALMLGSLGALGAEATDDEITAEVKRILRSSAETDGAQITVQTRDGIVQLSGFIETGHAKAAAKSAASGVPGVKEVHDDLIVRQGDRTLEQGGQDSIIAARVQQVLSDRSSQADDVEVEVRRGIVQLTGFVPTQGRKSQLERMVRDIDGVADVRNDILVSSER